MELEVSSSDQVWVTGRADKKKEPLRFSTGQQRPTVSVVIPTLNEAKNLPYVLPKIPDWVDEVILVDGHSKDNTVVLARKLLPDVRIVMQKGRGKGAALRTGFEEATGDIIVMLDADGSTDPGEISRYVLELLYGADFVKGSRFVQGGGTADMEFTRNLGNWGFVMLSRLLFGGKYSDLCYGYNAFWKSVLPCLELDADGFEIETMMNLRAMYKGLKVVEVPSFEAARIFGTSNLHAIRDGWRVLKTIFKEFARSHSKSSHASEQSQRAARYNLDGAIQLLVKEAMQFVIYGSQHMSPEARLETLGSLRASILELSNQRSDDAAGDHQRAVTASWHRNDAVQARVEPFPKVPPFYPEFSGGD
jgi:glycosyltransferase involved in cell wall biosynthesis